MLLLVGSLYSRNFLSPEYLLQQLKVASFLGVIATGMMLVILLGQIDLSVPWVVTAGAHDGLRRRLASARPAWRSPIPFGILCGVLLGLLNGVGVAYLRIPSMIITLAINAVAQGLMVVHTGGFSPRDFASPPMRYLATGFTVPGVPNAVVVWAIIGAIDRLPADAHHLRPRRLRHRQPRARRLSLRRQHAPRGDARPSRSPAGLPAFGGVLLAGYASKAAQAMGDAYLLPSIAAVVLGGTNILGGRGTYLGTVAGVILITLLQSILSVMQMEEWGRQVIYGVVIIAMLLLYGRERLSR